MQGGDQTQVKVVGPFLIISKACMNILYIVKWSHSHAPHNYVDYQAHNDFHTLSMQSISFNIYLLGSYRCWN